MTFPPQPNRPLLPADIIKRRPVSGVAMPISAFPVSSGMALTTLGPPPKTVLTIVSWNVQKFDEGKATANPYVNEVINQILAELSADVCLLLESRENNAVNLSAIDHRLANPTTYKEIVSDEADWDPAELAAEADEVLKKSALLASIETRYDMLSTDLTGKRYKPPERIYLFDAKNKNTRFRSMGKAYSIHPRSPKAAPQYTGEWKKVYRNSKVLQDYYDPWFDNPRSRITNLDAVVTDSVTEANVVFRLKECGACGKRLGTSVDCYACRDYGPYTTSSENLRNEIDKYAFSFGGVDLESYAILVRRQELGSFGDLVQMPGKMAVAHRYSAGLLRHGVPSTTPYTDEQRLAEFLFTRGAPLTTPADQACQWVCNDLMARKVDAARLMQSAELDALGVPDRSTRTRPLDDNQRWALFQAAQPNGSNPSDALIAQVRNTGVDPVNMSLGQMLDRVGVPDTETLPKQLEYEERAALFGTMFGASHPGKTAADVLRANGKDPKLVAFLAGLDGLNFPKSPLTGVRLPYLDPTASTYGRSPFLLCLSAWLGGESASIDVPVVGFHAPFGSDDGPGMQIRVDAVTQMLEGDVGGGKRLRDCDNAIIIGDLNLDPNESPGNVKGRAAADAYSRLLAAGFAPAIPKVPSSLTTVFNTRKKSKTDGPYKRFEDVPYQKLAGDVTSFTSSAYDNVLVRGAKLQSKVVTAAVIDVVGWILDKLTTSRLTNHHALLDWPDLYKLTPLQQAFFIYRNYVSDHLPVLVDIEVEPLKPTFGPFHEHLARIRRLRAARETVQAFKLAFSVCSFADSWPTASLVTLNSPKRNFYIAVIAALGPTHIDLDTADGPLRLPLPAPNVCAGMMAPDYFVALVVDTDDGHPRIYRMVSLANPQEAFFVLDANETAVFVLGTVMQLSTDGKRARIRVGKNYCVLTVPDGCGYPVKVGGYMMAVLQGCTVTERRVKV